MKRPRCDEEKSLANETRRDEGPDARVRSRENTLQACTHRAVPSSPKFACLPFLQLVESSLGERNVVHTLRYEERRSEAAMPLPPGHSLFALGEPRYPPKSQPLLRCASSSARLPSAPCEAVRYALFSTNSIGTVAVPRRDTQRGTGISYKVTSEMSLAQQRTKMKRTRQREPV